MLGYLGEISSYGARTYGNKTALVVDQRSFSAGGTSFGSAKEPVSRWPGSRPLGAADGPALGRGSRALT